MNKSVFVKQTYYLEYDENDPLVINALSEYQDVIDKRDNINDMIIHIISSIRNRGFNKMIEGVGYIKLPNHPPCGEPFCGITLIDDDPALEIDID